MKPSRIGSIVIGTVFGVALGAGGAYWCLRTVPSGTPGTGHAGHAVAEASPAGGAEHADEHGGHEGEGRIVLPEDVIRQNGIELAEAAGGDFEEVLTLPGEIALDADHVAHIVPRVAGIVRRVDKNMGDDVQAGEIMAILESRELAEAKAAFLGTQQKLDLAQANLASATELHAKKIMPDLEYLAIKTAQAETEIDLRTARNKLLALGLSAEQVETLPTQTDLAMYELRAPFAGTVIRKHCALGEALNSESDAFMLADLSTVWANITVYPQDIPRVRAGQTVHIRSDALAQTATGAVSYIAPTLNETARTVLARVALPNPDRQWRPGTFITASIVCRRETVPVLVPAEAVQRLKGGAVVFVEENGGFEPRPVVIGRGNAVHCEILSGLALGDRYAVKGAFVLKAEVGKSQAAHEH